MSAVRGPTQQVLERETSGFPRIPAIAAVAGTSLIGFTAGTLGGPFAALIFGAVGFLWGLLAFVVARRATRSSHRAMFANVSLYTATVAITCLTGVGLQIMPIMDVSITHAPQFFADLVRPPIGDAEALPDQPLSSVPARARNSARRGNIAHSPRRAPCWCSGSA